MRTAKLVGCLVASLMCLGTLEAQAHNVFKKALETKLGMKVDCNACHIDKQPKTERSSFGILFYKEFEAEELTKNWKTKKGADKKDYEEKVMVPAFEKAAEKVLAMKLEDLIKAGLFDGIKSAAALDSSVTSSQPKHPESLPRSLTMSPILFVIAHSPTSLQSPELQPANDERKVTAQN